MSLPSPDATTTPVSEVEQGAPKPNIESKPVQPQGEVEAEMVGIIDTNASNPDATLEVLVKFPIGEVEEPSTAEIPVIQESALIKEKARPEDDFRLRVEESITAFNITIDKLPELSVFIPNFGENGNAWQNRIEILMDGKQYDDSWSEVEKHEYYEKEQQKYDQLRREEEAAVSRTQELMGEDVVRMLAELKNLHIESPSDTQKMDELIDSLTIQVRTRQETIATQGNDEIQSLHIGEEPLTLTDQVACISEHLVGEVMQAVADKVYGQYERFASEINPQYIRYKYSKNETPVEHPLSQTDLSQLNKTFIETYVLPSLTKNGIILDADQRTQVVGLLEKAFVTKPAGRFDYQRNPEAEALQQEIEAFPNEIQSAIEPFIRPYDDIYHLPQNVAFEDIATFFLDQESLSKDTSLERYYHGVMLRLVEDKSTDNFPKKYDATARFRHQTELEDRFESLHGINDFLRRFDGNMDFERWQVLKKDEGFQARVGPDSLTRSERNIREKTLGALVGVINHDQSGAFSSGWMSDGEKGAGSYARTLNERLLKFVSNDALSTIILNTTRYPDVFLYRPKEAGWNTQWESMKDSYEGFFEHVNQLTPEDIQALSEPGLVETVSAIQKRNDVLFYPDQERLTRRGYTEKPETSDDPVILEFKQGIAKMVNFRLESGNPEQRLNLIHSLNNLSIDLGESYGILGSLMKDSDDYKIKEEIVNVLLSKSNIRHFSTEDEADYRAAEVLIANIGNLDEKQQGLIDTNFFMEFIKKRSTQEGEVKREWTDAFMKSLRSNDQVLNPARDSGEYHQDEIPDSKFEQFNLTVGKLITRVNTLEAEDRRKWNAVFEDEDVGAYDRFMKEKGYGFSEFFQNEYLLKYLSRQPERIDEVLGMAEATPELFKLLSEGGPLYTNNDNVLRNIFENGNAVRRAKEIETIFSKKVPYWRQLYLFTDARVGEQLAAADSTYPITEISGITFPSLVARHNELKSIDPKLTTRLESIVINPKIRGQIISGEADSVPFKDISGVYKKIIFRDYLRRSIEMSRSSGAKEDADSRNRESTQGEFMLQPEMYLHGSKINNLDNILLSGNLPGEALGEEARADSYPFQVDFTRITDKWLGEHSSLDEQITQSLSGGYGEGNEGMYLVYERNGKSWDNGKVAYGGGEYHALHLGGMPATEISAIILRNSDTTLSQAKKSVVENGFYIPIHDLSGNLLFSPEEYDSTRQDNNMKVPVEIWDNGLKTGEQLGSNPGGEFTIPESTGPTRYYVKFVNPENWEHMWSEQLADNIYKQLGIPVPDTKIVKVEGTYGHASKLLLADEVQNQVDLKDGFLADALLANWDAIYNKANNLVSGSRTYRIDNGGALFFRARGERKSNDLFGETVREIEVGDNRERLGFGMKQEYPGLTDDDIRKQAESMQTNLTDETIDSLVDSVRLPKEQRDQIVETLRARRDYIIGSVILK